MRDDETITDQGDDFEVYERKRPRADTRPGSAPDISRSGDVPPPIPADEDAPADPADGAWLMADPAPDQRDLPLQEDAEAPSHFLGGLFDAADADDPARSIPDPPAEPMRVEDAAPGSATAASGPATAASSPATSRTGTTPSTPSSSTPYSRGESMRIAIAATEFNYDITHMMIERARAHAEFLGASVDHVLRVPGVYDLPLAVKKLLGRSDVDAVATLGVVIEGETDHDDLVIQHAARKIIDLSLEHDKPVGLGITGPGMSRLQAEARIDRAKDAVEACVKLHRTLSAY